MATPINDGTTYNIDNFSNKNECAKVWAEGDKGLESCLLTLWKDNIKTRACCAHDKYIYIQLDNFNNNLGGLFQLVEDDLAFIKFGVLHIDLEDELFDGYFLSIHENKDNPVDDFFKRVYDAYAKNISFDEGLIKYNHNLFSVFKKFQEKTSQPMFQTPLISRVQFLAEKDNAGYLDVMRENFKPIKNNKLSHIYNILKGVERREKVMENLNFQK